MQHVYGVYGARELDEEKGVSAPLILVSDYSVRSRFSLP